MKKEVLETTYQVISDELQKALAILSVTRKSMFGKYDGMREDINPYDIDCLFATMQDILVPLSDEIAEAACNAEYFLWDKKNKNKNIIWDKVEDLLSYKSL